MRSRATLVTARSTVVTVPGLHGSGDGHWQTLWERGRPGTIRADLGSWDAPRRNSWIVRLDEAVRRARAPVVLAAHSLGCLAVAWWAHFLPQSHDWPVTGALLVAPADVDRPDAADLLRDFAPTPASTLPFASLVIASANDPWMSVDRARDLATVWGSRFVEAGPLGHINAESGIGDWPAGRDLLDELVVDGSTRRKEIDAVQPAGRSPRAALVPRVRP